MQAQLVQSEKLASLGHLVGGAAHELNNPLTAMLGYSELLLATELSSEQRSLSDKISQQAKRIRALVASLLSFAKQVPASKAAVDVNLVIQTAFKLCRTQLQSATAQYTADLEESLPNVTSLDIVAGIEGRGRDASCPAPPAPIRTCTFMHTALTSGA